MLLDTEMALELSKKVHMQRLEVYIASGPYLWWVSQYLADAQGC